MTTRSTELCAEKFYFKAEAKTFQKVEPGKNKHLKEKAQEKEVGSCQG